MGASVGDEVLPGAPEVVILVGELVDVPVVGPAVLGGLGMVGADVDDPDVGADVVDPDDGAAVVPGATVVPVVGAAVVVPVDGAAVVGAVVEGASVGAVVVTGVSEYMTTITTESGSDRCDATATGPPGISTLIPNNPPLEKEDNNAVLTSRGTA